MSSFSLPTLVSRILSGADVPFDSDTHERELIASARGGDSEAFGAILLGYARLIRSSAATFPSLYQDPDALQSAIGTAMFDAILAFDPETDEHLARRAKPLLLDALSETGAPSAINVPARRFRHYVAILREAGGNNADAERIAPEHGMSAATFRAIREASAQVATTAPSDDDGEAHSTAWEAEARSLTATPPPAPEDFDERHIVDHALSSISDLPLDIVRLAYGFSDYEPVSDPEIGERLGMSKAKVQRVRSGALDTMRSSLGLSR